MISLEDFEKRYNDSLKLVGDLSSVHREWIRKIEVKIEDFASILSECGFTVIFNQAKNLRDVEYYLSDLQSEIDDLCDECGHLIKTGYSDYEQKDYIQALMKTSSVLEKITSKLESYENIMTLQVLRMDQILEEVEKCKSSSWLVVKSVTSQIKSILCDLHVIVDCKTSVLADDIEMLDGYLDSQIIV